jgi:acyl-homoserine-lactone acylase
MPTLFRRDYVQNSNDSYRLSNPEAPLPAAEPMFGPTDAPPNPRTQSGILEIRNRLSGGDGLPGNRFDHASARAILFANKSLIADRMLEDLIAICEGDAALEVACNALRSWDRHANLESRGALLFFEFLRRLAPVDHYWAIPFDPGNALGTPSGLVRDEPKASEIRAALGAAANELASLNIPLDAPLGAYQVVNGAGHAVPVHGGPHPAGILNVIFSRPANGVLNPVTGSSYIQIVGFDESGPIADSVLTYSQSSSPGSPHFADQTRVYSDKRLHRLPFAPRDIAGARIAPPVHIRE